MPTVLMELMHHLQNVHIHHPYDDGRIIVAVPTTPHAVEQFEWERFIRTDPDWSCTASPFRMKRTGHRMNKPRHRMNKPRLLRKKPGLASITTTRICSDEVGRAWLRTATGLFRFAPVNRQHIVQIAGGAG